tara:strand:+ start:196 stop:1932 length:1737 start_codon:yes stop_codon:yes gene_type:complete
MNTRMYKNFFKYLFSLLMSFSLFAQDFSPEFLESLPAEVREEILNSALEKESLESTQYRRPSTFIQKPDVNSARFGNQYFSMMQSTLMPINEPNLDPNYILGFGDVLQLQLVGQKNEIIEVSLLRDGSITLPNIGKVFLSGLSLQEATKIIKTKFEISFIGVNVFVTLLNIRDIQILVSGNAFNPGPYTLNGNSNLFHALSVSGGPSDLGSFRKIDLIREDKILETVDLYENFIFGKNSFGPKLRSGDIIFIHPSQNLVSISGAIKRPGNYELLNTERLGSLIDFANGIRGNADLDSIHIQRIDNGKAVQVKASPVNFKEEILNDEESVFIRAYPFRSVTISGSVEKPGSYLLNEGDGILELVNLAGGYTENAYQFGGVLLNKEAFEVSKNAKERLYEDFISSFIENSFSAGGETFESLNIFINELKNSSVSGRINAEFNLEKLKSNPSLNVKLMEGDEIIIPEIVDHIYIFGEIANQGTINYVANQTLSDYLDNVGGITNYADKSSIFILHPNGVSERVSRKNVFRDNNDEFMIYPGSIIFVPREIPNTFRAEVFQGYASILGNLGVSLASISVLKD